MRHPLVSLSGVTRRFGDVTAVDHLSLEIGPGETVALLGPNGAGKTTAVELMLGLRRPDAGRVRLFGGPPDDAISAGRVGAMLQEGDLPAGAKVAELVDLVRGLYPSPLPLAAALRLGDVEEIADRQVERVSGGQRQRVRLAIALAGGPELLVLDEPTAAMDVAVRRSFWSAASEYVSDGCSLLFATHRLEEAEQVADRIVVMASGRLVADGPLDAVKALSRGRAMVSFRANGAPIALLERLPAVDEVELARGRVTLRTADPDRTVRALFEAAPHTDDLEVTSPPARGRLPDPDLRGGLPMTAYLRVEVLRQFRNRDALAWRLGLPAALYVFFRAVFGSDGTSEGLPSDTTALVIFGVFGTLAAGLYSTAPALAQERATGWLRQLRVTPLPAWATVAGKVAAAMAYALPALALVGVAAAATQGVTLGFGLWVELALLLWIATAPFAALGVLIGLTIRNAEPAQSAASAAMIVLWVLGGMVTSPSDLPGALEAVAHTLPTNAAAELGWAAARREAIPASAIAVVVNWTAALGALAALAWRRLGGAR